MDKNQPQKHKQRKPSKGEPNADAERAPVTVEYRRKPANPTMARGMRFVGQATSGRRTTHPGLIPGIGVEKTGVVYKTSWIVFGIALAASLGVLAWAVIAPQNLLDVGTTMREGVTSNFGWFFTALILLIMVFMFVIALAPTGNIKLGEDDEEPDYSRATWISMLFAAGLGIGLIFYGPMEPMQHFIDAPPASDAPSGDSANVLPAMSQALLHQTLFTWGIYALVGGAIAYASYRRGRLPLISGLFEPVFPDGPNRLLGKIIDVFAVLVTLFGTATSLGIGALQIQAGTEIVTGWSVAGNKFLIGAVTILTCVFIYSAVSGVKKGLRILSNMNMFLVIFLALFVLVTGPTLFVLDLIPTSLVHYLSTFPDMFAISPSQGEETAEFMTAWTTMYWAWWISWSPFVGMFIAKISRGRTIREFTFTVILGPGLISVVWYVIFGGTAIYQVLNDFGLEIKGSGENVMFDLLGELPLASVMQVITLLAVLIFFTTAADSATLVMGTMSQHGRPEPSRWATVTWGVALGSVSLALLLIGGQNALSGLQAIMVASALPFAIILLGVMWCWFVDLRNDPYMIRRHYAKSAIAQGVRRGIEEHGDDFVFGAEGVDPEEGAGAKSRYESEDPELSEWYTEHAEAREEAEAVAAEDPDASTPGPIHVEGKEYDDTPPPPQH
ncbi:glycine betaine transporter [Corynebacterium renale]|uniref:BCCT family transporter n=1 Tax=Corynebacterium renale TaxID=1724 RepID=UPI000DA347A2|nr:BCCT family transporter [Corynebacterium renale]SQG65162.1 glycine betaine transporter [Corynebacterium renale]STC98136.1 glycine betaine transporter [Corynebacterium renale]